MHFKEEKSHKKQILAVLIAVELILSAAASYVIYTISWEHITARRCAAVTESVTDFGTRPMTVKIGSCMQKARESIRKVVDQTIWTKANVYYRVGPDITYDSAGSLGAYTRLTRTGVTYNKWSRVTVNEESYYIKSEFVTTEEPLITEGGRKGEYQRYALSQLANYGWADSEIIPLIKLWNRESGWNPSSHNKSSGAHGIPQALPASKMAVEGADYYTNGNTQIRWGLSYIRNRYGSPSNAWAHFCSSGWY